MSRTKGADLDEKTIHALLDKHVALGRCSPGQLWKLRSISTSGVTSDWAAIKAAQPLLSDIIDETGGKGINQKLFARQLDTWLKSHSMIWEFLEVEASAKRLRAMFSTLLAVRREQKSVPRTYAMIEAVAIKMVLEASPCKSKASQNEDDDDDDDERDADNGQVRNDGHQCELQGSAEEDEIDKCASALFSKPTKRPTTPSKRPRQPLIQIKKTSSFTLFNLGRAPDASEDSMYSKIQTMVDGEPLTPPTKHEYTAMSKKGAKKTVKQVTIALYFFRPSMRLYKAGLTRPNKDL